jgi:predicted ATP-dependent serine protease
MPNGVRKLVAAAVLEICKKKAGDTTILRFGRGHFGRDEEIAMLMRRWERARQGNGQLVLIVGEPGLGKSRLVEEFHARLRET